MKSREQKRKEAEQRQAERDKLTPAQQLAKLDKYGFTAWRERARLTKGTV